jgi:hypothetical protein
MIMLTRRRFIGTTLVAGATLATGAHQARPQPASKRTIVDAQVHLWKANSPVGKAEWIPIRSSGSGTRSSINKLVRVKLTPPAKAHGQLVAAGVELWEYDLDSSIAERLR